MANIVVLRKSGGSVAVNVEQIVYFEAEQMGKATEIYLTNGQKLVVDEAFDEVSQRLIRGS